MCISLTLGQCYIREASKLTQEVFAMFDPHFRAYSLDEASLHLSPYLAKHPDESAEQVAERVRALVNQRTQLTCSIGTRLCRRPSRHACT